MMTDEQGGNMQIIITSPSLDPAENVSGISSVTRFIIENNPAAEYLHFTLGRKDNERGGWHRIGALLGRYRSWRRMLAEYPEAIIHYNFPLSKGSILRDPWFIHYAIRRRRKVVVHVHGGLFLTAPQIPGYLLRIMRGVFTQNVPFIVLSDSERQILTQRFGAREVYVLPNCVDLTDAAAYAAEGQTRAEDAPLCIGYLGRIEPNKGMSELLAACEQLQKDDLPYHLILAGKEETTGEYLPQFAERLGDRFTYAGLVSGQTKCAFLRGFDAFVLPSYFEGLPMSLLECMSYGKAPIVTPVGSIPQVVRDGENGLYIKDHDAASIAEAIRRLAGDRALLERLGTAARQTILTQFSPTRYVTQLNEIYHSLG